MEKPKEKKIERKLRVQTMIEKTIQINNNHLEEISSLEEADSKKIHRIKANNVGYMYKNRNSIKLKQKINAKRKQQPQCIL